MLKVWGQGLALGYTLAVFTNVMLQLLGSVVLNVLYARASYVQENTVGNPVLPF